MRIIRAADCRTMPWKNGGGTTTQIAAHPPGASLDTFEWRISMAHVGMDGPFSVFPGIDRTLSVLTGNGIALAFGDGEAVRLERSSEPYPFAADRAVEGRLVEGAIDDLNVMTRRGRWRHMVRRLAGSGPFQLMNDAALLVVIARSDGWTATMAGEAVSLATGDSLIVEAGSPTLAGDRPGGEIYAVELWMGAA